MVARGASPPQEAEDLLVPQVVCSHHALACWVWRVRVVTAAPAWGPAPISWWWGVLALLRALGSSPAAAAATLRTRAQTVESGDAAEADEIGRRTVFDLDPTDEDAGHDVVAGADVASFGKKSSSTLYVPTVCVL